MFERLIGKVWAKAAPIEPPDNPFEKRFDSLADILGFLMNVIFFTGITLSIIFLIVGGIRYISSGGDKAGVEAARGAITNAIIGFVIVLGAFAARIIIQNVIGVKEEVIVNNVVPPF